MPLGVMQGREHAVPTARIIDQDHPGNGDASKSVQGDETLVEFVRLRHVGSSRTYETVAPPAHYQDCIPHGLRRLELPRSAGYILS